MYAATKGFLDKVPASAMTTAEQLILDQVNPSLFKIIKSKGKITPEITHHLNAELYKISFPAKA
jgi:F-type H+-transporting ATPase subunit alpha